MGELGKLGDKFPEKLRRAQRLDAAGIESWGNQKPERAQKPRENGDKSYETEDTVSTTTLARGTGDTNVMNTNDNQDQTTTTSTRSPRNDHRDPAELAFERGTNALEQLAAKGVRIEVHSDPTDYSMAATALKGAAVGAIIGGAAAGLTVGFATKAPSVSSIVGASTAGAAGGGLLGAAVAVTVFDGKPKKEKAEKK